MTYEQLPDEWKEWVDLTPLERFRRSEGGVCLITQPMLDRLS